MTMTLENFEYDVFAKTTPDVLNSPRSLEACSRLHIEANELVYRNLEEYEEQLADLPLSEIYRIYEVNETKRQSKLLKCRQLRKQIICDELRKETTQKRGMSSMTRDDKIRRLRNQDFGGSDSEINYCSDTESHDENRNNLKKKENEKLNYNSKKKFFKPIISRLKSRSNIDFKKIANTPRQFCPCQLNLNDNEIIKDYIKKYGDIISSTNDLSRDDKKILELLILKKGRQAEWDKKSQELRKAIEEDKISQYRRNQLKMENWIERLAQKRNLENIENSNRYLTLEQQAEEHRLNLLKYLELRDSKTQNYLDQMQYQKRKLMLERHRQDALRQLEVGRAIDRVVEADKQHRQDLAEKLNQRMADSEIRRKRRELDNLRHISEMNKLEEVKRELKLEKLDQETRHSIEVLRNQIEEKEHRSTMNYLANLRMRNTLLLQSVGNRNLAVEKTRKVHSELLRGLEEWNQKVNELHLAAQERATMNYYAEINRRRARVASERILREERSTEILRRVKEMEERRRNLMKTVIECKDYRSARWKEEKEQQIYISRLRAQHGAELREALREKLDPKTFDKKAARADIECRLLQKLEKIPIRSSIKVTNEIPKVNIDENCHCQCGCGGFPLSRNHTLQTNS